MSSIGIDIDIVIGIDIGIDIDIVFTIFKQFMKEKMMKRVSVGHIMQLGKIAMPQQSVYWEYNKLSCALLFDDYWNGCPAAIEH